MARSGISGFGGGDFSSVYVERGEIYDFVRDHGITGFATVAGDRHSFWAVWPRSLFPPKPSSLLEWLSPPAQFQLLDWSKLSNIISKGPSPSTVFCWAGSSGLRSRPTVNLLLRHGVRSCLEYSRSGDIAKARALTNPTFHRIFLLWIWAGTDMPWFGSPLKALKPNLFASHVLWSAVIGLTEARSYIAWCIGRGFGKRAKCPGLRRRF